MRRKYSFDCLTFVDEMTKRLGIEFQSFLARGIETAPSTVNGWCSIDRSKSGPGPEFRAKIDKFLIENNHAPIDWEPLVLPKGTDIQAHYNRLHNVDSIIEEEPSPDIWVQYLDLQKENLILQKKLLEKDIEILAEKKSANEAKIQLHALKKQLEILKNTTTAKE